MDTEPAHLNVWTGAEPADKKGDSEEGWPPPGFHISLTYSAQDSRTPAHPSPRTQGSCPLLLQTLESRPPASSSLNQESISQPLLPQIQECRSQALLCHPGPRPHFLGLWVAGCWTWF